MPRNQNNDDSLRNAIAQIVREELAIIYRDRIEGFQGRDTNQDEASTRTRRRTRRRRSTSSQRGRVKNPNDRRLKQNRGQE